MSMSSKNNIKFFVCVLSIPSETSDERDISSKFFLNSKDADESIAELDKVIRSTKKMTRFQTGGQRELYSYRAHETAGRLSMEMRIVSFEAMTNQEIQLEVMAMMSITLVQAMHYQW